MSQTINSQSTKHINNHVLWTELYKPTTSNDLACGKKISDSIKDWLNNWEIQKIKALHILSQRISKRKSKSEKELPKSCALIVGPVGVGKTTTANVIIDECGYCVYKLNLTGVKNVKGLTEMINSAVKSTNITDLIDGKKQKKIVVVIDGLESITTSIEKSVIKSLQKENDTNWYFPIIFISDEKHNKLLVEFIKVCLKFKFYAPAPFILDKIMTKIMVENKMFVDNKETNDIIIDHCQKDIRRLVNTLQELYNIYNTKKLTSSKIKEYCMMSQRKDLDVGLFDATKNLLYKYESIENCMLLFNKAKVLLPLMVQQNYMSATIDKAKRNGLTHKDALKTMMEVSESLSNGDIAENYVYAEQNWGAQDIHGQHTCVETSFYMSKLDNKDVDVDNLFVNLGYAFDLNRTSIKNINKKNIANTDECFRNLNIFDYLYINIILKTLLSENKLKKFIKLLKGYNIKIEHIESLLKIDKIKKSKNKTYILTSKQKNILSKYLCKK
jgi:DNA polymerase III delta prime subunit